MPTFNAIKSIQFSEVESAFKSLNSAIIGHTKWLTDWNANAVCALSIEGEYLERDSHKLSNFGRWYYSEHPDIICKSPDYLVIEELYVLVHEKVRMIVEKINSGHGVTLIEYNEFIKTEAAFSATVIRLRDEVYNLLLSFDYLTGVLNRQAHMHILEREYARFVRQNESCCLAMMDIDNFKPINDKHGHDAGDRVLASIASFIIKEIRPYDSVCRYGGEEFLICMPNTTIEQSHAVIDRIRNDLSKHKIQIADNTFITVSSSFGVAAMSIDEKWKDTITCADQAMYRAKECGRNKVEIWNEEESSINKKQNMM